MIERHCDSTKRSERARSIDRSPLLPIFESCSLPVQSLRRINDLQPIVAVFNQGIGKNFPTRAARSLLSLWAEGRRATPREKTASRRFALCGLPLFLEWRSDVRLPFRRSSIASRLICRGACITRTRGGEVMATARKTEFLTPWDAAKYLRSEQDIAAYLAAALEAAADDAAFMTLVREDVARARAALETQRDHRTSEGSRQSISVVRAR